MSLPLTMAGYERTYRPPRSLREHVGAEVTAWELFRLEHDERAGQWAGATLASVVAAAEAGGVGVLGCTECLDTGFYGIPDLDNPDLLQGLVRRTGNGAHETLTAGGDWEPWEPCSALEVLDTDLAGDLAEAIVSGASGLLRLYGQPRAFLPPDEVLSAGAPVIPQEVSGDSWTTYAVVPDEDPGAVLDLVRYRSGESERWEGAGWTPDTDIAQMSGVPMVELNDRQLEDVLAQLQPIVADAPLTVSPDPRAERLRRYWSSGRGAAKIRWLTPGDWKRCYRHLVKYMGPRAKGYCFTGDTEFITRDGTCTFRDAVGTTQLVLSQAVGDAVREDGYWVSAPIRSFGEQPVLTVTLRRGGITKVIRATPEHRWIASPNGRNARRFDANMVLTRDLQPGMVLAMLSARQDTLPGTLPPDAICAGAVFGDGSRAGASSSRIDLYHSKRELTPLFEPFASSVSVDKPMASTDLLADRVYGLPREWKDAPSLARTDHWLAGWLAGYIATDGSLSADGSITISSARRDSLDLVRDVCDRLGIMASGVRSTLRTGGYESTPTPIYRVVLYAHTVPEALLVRSDQRARFRRPAKTTGRWTVVSVEDRGEREEVFCATVPGTESFALAGNIWTFNCQNLHKRNTGVWTGSRFNVGGNGRRGRLFGSAAPESALLAAVQSRRMTTEGKSDMPTSLLADGVYTETDDADDALLQALAASAIPVAPPDEWFDDPGLTKPTTLTITDEGRVFGHIAPWGVSHIGMAGAVPAPKNRSGQYAYFRTGQLRTASGKDVRVGQLTLAGGHAPLQVGAQAAVQHYDDTNSGVADVAVGEDDHGIWAAGALRPNVTAEQVRVMRACPVSGDWRPINGNLELVAACHVNVQGFPIAAAAYQGGAITALVAAGARQMAELRLAEQAEHAVVQRLAHLETLVAGLTASTPPPEPAPPPEADDNPAAAETQEPEPVTAPVEPDNPEFSDEELTRAGKISRARALIEQTRRQALRDRVHAATVAGAPPTMAERKAKPTIPGTLSFPIGNVADLKKAIHAYGRAGDKPAARKHIITQAYKLKRPDLIPDDWRSSK